MITPEDLARDRALCDAANANDLMWSEHEVEFIAAARERWPLYIAEVERLREEVMTLQSFLEVMDGAGVRMNGMKPTEALDKLGEIAGAPARSAER